MPDFLLEIGCEEIPARMIATASQELRERVAALLRRERLSDGEITHFDTPRRLAVMASGIASAQADVVEQVNGPSLNVAYQDGQPTAAAHAFAKKAGVDVTKLEKVTTAKGEYLAAKVTKKAAARPRFLLKACPKNCPRFTGPRTCIGGSRTNGSCVQCAGWSPCSMRKRFLWSLTGCGRERFPKGTGFCRTVA